MYVCVSNIKVRIFVNLTWLLTLRGSQSNHSLSRSWGKNIKKASESYIVVHASLLFYLIVLPSSTQGWVYNTLHWCKHFSDPSAQKGNKCPSRFTLLKSVCFNAYIYIFLISLNLNNGIVFGDEFPVGWGLREDDPPCL